MLNKTFDTLGYKGSKIEMGYDGVTTFEWTKKLRDLSINFKS